MADGDALLLLLGTIVVLFLFACFYPYGNIGNSNERMQHNTSNMTSFNCTTTIINNITLKERMFQSPTANELEK